jgi:hypothetical protein
MGALLKYVVRECESNGTAQATAKAMKQIVRTFNITLKGEVVKSTGKKNTKAVTSRFHFRPWHDADRRRYL